MLFLATSGILKASSMICEFLGIVLVKKSESVRVGVRREVKKVAEANFNFGKIVKKSHAGKPDSKDEEGGVQWILTNI